MMIYAITFPVALISAAIIAWILGSGKERKASTVRIAGLEHQLKNSQTRAAGLAKEVTELKDNIRVLDANLREETAAKESAVLQLQNPLKKSSIIMATACLAAGVIFGGAVTGLVTSSRVDMKYREKMTDLTVRAEVAETRSEYLRQRRQAQDQELAFYRRQVLEEKEKKAVATAKLDMVLEQLITGKFGKALTIDLEKMRSGLKHEAVGRESQASRQNTDAVTIPMPSLL